MKKSKPLRDKLAQKKWGYITQLHSLEAFDTDCTSTVYKVAGTVLKEIRAEKGVSQKQICDALTIPQATLSQIENGRYNVGLHRYLEILTLLDVDLNTFVEKIKEKHNARV